MNSFDGHENTQQSLEEVSSNYFTLTPETALLSSLFGIPFDIWKVHIVSSLWQTDKKALRATCRGFLFLVSQLWKPRISCYHLEEVLYFSSEVCPQWPLQLYSIHFYGSKFCCDLQNLTRLRSL